LTSSELETPPLDIARRLAEDGDLDGAAAILAELASTPGGPDVAQAAVGLAVVLDQRGDVDGARAAARTALATGHPEFAAQAACHLAQGFEREGRYGQARGAWQAVLGVGTPAYVPLAHLALARLAVETGEYDEAETELRAAIDTGHAPPTGQGAADNAPPTGGRHVPDDAQARAGGAMGTANGGRNGAPDHADGTGAAKDTRGPGHAAGDTGAYGHPAGGAGGHGGADVRVHASQQLADLLMERGEPGEAAEVLLDALEDASGDDAARLRVQLGIAHLELACAEFAGAVEDGGEGQTTALAIELLARTLPLRGRADDADHVWAYGLNHDDETLASEVRLRYDRD
jgi:tetratricopeptide (TPR) repeat protein